MLICLRIALLALPGLKVEYISVSAIYVNAMATLIYATQRAEHAL